jgi:hypothetical protein
MKLKADPTSLKGPFGAGPRKSLCAHASGLAAHRRTLCPQDSYDGVWASFGSTKVGRYNSGNHR